MIRILKGNKGQTLVETALILPLLLLIILGIFEFGRIMSTYIVVNNASREAARCAVVGASDADIISSVYSSTYSLDPAALKVTVTPSRSSRIRGTQVTVQIDYEINLITPIISSIVPNPFKIRLKTVMRME